MLPLLLLLPFVHTAPVEVAAQYSDDFARNVMLPLAAAAYGNQHRQCLATVFSDGKLKRQVNITSDYGFNSGYTAVSNSAKAIIVSIRGTPSFLKQAELRNWDYFDGEDNWIAGGKVCAIFNSAFISLWNGGMKDDFLSLINANPSYNVWITGHSNGGAIAALYASYIVSLKYVPSSQVKLITFGQPRTGNTNFSKAFDAQMDNAFRVIHFKDFVPHQPKMGFADYYHHKTEVFYQDPMGPTAYTVCQKDEDNQCSDGLLMPISTNEHFNYMGRDVATFGQNGCR